MANRLSILNEFKTFAMRGNVVDLAVGIVVGAAFTGIINSLVKDVITPPIGWVLGGLDFTNVFWVLKGPHLATLKASQDAGAISLNVGLLANAVFNFLIVALVLFLILRQINRLTAPKEAPPAPATPEDVELLREIRDLLKTK
jgi:large conductance mechanosensitive channel